MTAACSGELLGWADLDQSTQNAREASQGAGLQDDNYKSMFEELAHGLQPPLY